MSTDREMTVEELAEQLGFLVRGGQTPEESARFLTRASGRPDLVDKALEQYRERAQRMRILREPGAIVDDHIESWYLGPDYDNDVFWPAFRAHLQKAGRPADEIQSVDDASTKIISLLSHPGMGAIRTRGLVLGHVQSGKTRNFTAVIAKAADAGYQLFLVLSGMTNKLRAQTQRRLDSDIVNLNPERWVALTTVEHDFRSRENVNAFLSDIHETRAIGVVKKNSSRLRGLYRWLNGARPEILTRCPVLIIDDEADQATPNAHPDPDERTAINRWLVDLLGLLPKAAYIGYTATPFANLLIDPGPHDLYPRNFIVDLPRPADYYGPERIFGRAPVDGEEPSDVEDGLDVIRNVPDAEVPLLRAPQAARHDFTATVTPSLEEALHWFWMVTAARCARVQRSQHSTMLIHTSQYIDVHEGFGVPLEAFREQVLSDLHSGNADRMDELRRLWDREAGVVPPESVGADSTTFDEMARHLVDAVDRTEIKVENAVSRDRIDYETEPDDPGRVYVVVGGNVLSRGLTLEGLSVSFFIRTASAYDTLLQMGRWFGFRPGYADLPRMWMTADLRNWFYDLATVEREIRYEIERYERGHFTPLQAGVRIRTHPQLAITSRLKMQHAVPAKMSFAGQQVQTLVFHRRDAEWLKGNIGAARELVRRARSAGRGPDRLQGRPPLILTEVPVDLILDFLCAYSIHEDHLEMRADLLRDYIIAERGRGRLGLWNVGVVTRRLDSALGTMDLGLGERVPLVNRSRFLRRDVQRDADVKALMSERDAALDVDLPSDQLRDWDRATIIDRRDEIIPDRGLLLLYPISRDSTPRGGSRTSKERRRVPLDAVEHVIGLAMVFPDPEDAAAVSYMTVDLSGEEREVTDDEVEEVAL